MSNPTKFYGKYRGTVKVNVDPLQTGRLLLEVPDVYGAGMSSWALACVPLTGKQTGAWFLPQVGAGVWVEFEKGDPDYPIWTGCWWGSAAEPPALALSGVPASPSIVLQTPGQNTFMMSDVPGSGGFLLKTKTGAMISINETGITISNGQGATVSLTGPTVSVNNGALSIT